MPQRCPVVSNIDATQLTDPAAIRAELANHIVAPVRWLDGIHAIEALGVRHIVEFGSRLNPYRHAATHGERH